MPMSSNTLNADLLARYLVGEASEQERLHVTEFLQTHSAHAELADQLRTLSESASTSGNTLDVDKAVAGFFERVTQHQRFVTSERENSARRRIAGKGSFVLPTLRRWVWFATTAATVGALFAMLRVYPPLSRQRSPRIYTTTAGQSATITLGDGSHVLLGPLSRLSVFNAGAKTRTVSVEGEAYFTVTQSASVPFLVESGNVTARVLGTEFLVRHRDSGAGVRVSVANGKIYMAARNHPQNGVILSSGQVGNLTDSIVHVTAFDEVVPGTEWVHGQLVFHDTPVEVILSTMSRWYGYQFRCTDSTLLHRAVTMVVSTQSSVEALAVLKQVLSVNLVVTGDMVTLTPHVQRPRTGTPRVREYDVWIPKRELGR